MEFTVITSEKDLAATTQEWALLRNRAARFPFADPDLFSAWWHNRGKHGARKLHIATGRQDGKLTALAPLVVTRRWGIRILEWGGSEMFDYCDALLEAPSLGEPLWDAIRRSGLYDFALLRDVHSRASCSSAIGAFARPVGSRPVAAIEFQWPAGSVWMSEALSTSTRAYFRRTERRLSQIGPLRFEVCRGQPVPARVLNALHRQKTEWLQARAKPSLLSKPAGVNLLHDIARTAAEASDLHLCWLECGDEIIATHLGFERHGLLYWYLPSYSMEWAKYAPGRLLLLKLICWAIDHGLSGFDFLRGEEAYKAQLANDYHSLTDFMFAGSDIARLAERSLIAWYLRRKAG